MSDENANAKCGEGLGACSRNGQAGDDHAQRSGQEQVSEPESISFPVTDAIRSLARDKARKRAQDFLRSVELARHDCYTRFGVKPNRVMIDLTTFERFRWDFEQTVTYTKPSDLVGSYIMGMKVLRVLDTEDKILICIP